MKTQGIEKEPLYYRLDSTGEGTNLQLGSLRRGYKAWERLQEERGVLPNGEIHGRCCEVLHDLGLSLNQLLGQVLGGSSRRVPSFRVLLRSFLVKARKEKAISLGKSSELEGDFGEFVEIWDAYRHLGESKAPIISRLSVEKTASFVELIIQLWILILNVEKKSSGNDLGVFDHYTFIEFLREQAYYP